MARSAKFVILAVAFAGLVPVVASTVAGATTVPGEDLDAWALEYIGGTAGEASGDPIKIGYANSEDYFPEGTIGIEAAVEYVNAELGGADGRPLELVSCNVATAEDGASCGADFANDDSISIVLTGTILFGNGDFYAALDGNKPLLIGNGLTVDDFVTPAGQSFTAGSVGVVAGLAKFIVEDLQPAKVAVIFADNAAGQAAANVLFKPTIDAAGIEIAMVPVADTATAPDVASAIQAAGADSADILVPLVTLQNCINTYDAIESLSIDPVVVTSGLCFGTPMSTHLHDLGVEADFPDGWYNGGYGYSYFIEPFDFDSGMATYIAAVNEYGQPVEGQTVLEYTGFAGPMFGNLLTAVQFMNTIGVDNLSYETLNEAIRTFEGPMIMQVGPIACGLPPFVASCGHQMGIQQYVDGAFVSIRDGNNEDPVDVTPAA